MQLRLRSVLKGAATFIPGVTRLANSAAGTWMGARYYYAVWLRHLVSVHRTLGKVDLDVVAELGPGDAVGVGLCALLSGARRYLGLDRLAFASPPESVALLDTLVALFEARAPIPDADEFPGVFPRLDDYAFPDHILGPRRLAESLSPSRVAAIRAAITDGGGTEVEFRYVAPWDAESNVEAGSVDWILSQAVLEHVDEIDSVYSALHRWLKSTGVMSHRIDYTCHGITHDWFGHWTVSDPMWRLARGKRAYFINRLPHSAHCAALRREGFEILAEQPTLADDPAPAADVRVAYDVADLSIKGAFVIARPGGRA